MDKFEFGKYLRKIRKARALTIHQVQLYAGVSNSYISLLERGERDIPSPEILKKLAPLYKVNYDELMKAAGYMDSINTIFEDPTIVKESINDNIYKAAIEKAKNKNISPEKLDKLIDLASGILDDK